MRILITCPPMLGLKNQFIPLLNQYGIEAVCPDIIQTMSIEDLCKIVPTVEGWIIGDDPATKEVFQAGISGKLRAAVKWGIGVDNVDFDACKELSIPISNTPGMFGCEVADVALGYIIALARETFSIDRGIRNGSWPKNTGISLAGKTVGVIGYGDIGSSLIKRLEACDMNMIAWDPAVSQISNKSTILRNWPNGIDKCDFLVMTCSLNKHNTHMLNSDTLALCKNGVRVVNVARGQLIDESALITALRKKNVHSAALDVFEAEPLPMESFLREHPLCILGSHNSSNSIDAVRKTNIIAIEKIIKYLGIKKQ